MKRTIVVKRQKHYVSVRPSLRGDHHDNVSSLMKGCLLGYMCCGSAIATSYQVPMDIRFVLAPCKKDIMYSFMKNEHKNSHCDT